MLFTTLFQIACFFLHLACKSWKKLLAGRPLVVGICPIQLWPLLLSKAILKVMKAYRLLEKSSPDEVNQEKIGDSDLTLLQGIRYKLIIAESSTSW